MTDQEKRTASLFPFLGILVLLGLSIAYLAWVPRETRTNPEPPRGRNIFLSVSPEATNASESLATLAWEDIAPSIEGMSRDMVFRGKLLAATAQVRGAPALYLRALLLLASDDPRQALDTFLAIPPAEIPPLHLYAPFRLHAALNPGVPNPYQAPLNQAIADNRVQPLIKARVWAVEGRLQDSLREYLKTDPAEWADLDLRAFRTMRLHAGLSNDTAAMLQAALRGGRVRDAQRTELVAMLNAPRDKGVLDELKAQFLRRMNSSQAVRDAVRAGALRQIALRKTFVLKKYRELLDEYRDMPPIQLPDESILLLTLSAAQEKDASAWPVWSGELLRRFPTPEVKKWLNQLIPPLR